MSDSHNDNEKPDISDKQVNFTLSTCAGQALMKQLSEKKSSSTDTTALDIDEQEKIPDAGLGTGGDLTQTSVSDDVLDETETENCENTQDSLTDDQNNSSKPDNVNNETEPDKCQPSPKVKKLPIKFKKIEYQSLLSYIKFYRVYILLALFMIVALYGLLGYSNKSKQESDLNQKIEQHKVKSFKSDPVTLNTLQEDLDALLDKVASSENTNVDKQAVLKQLSQLTKMFDALRLEKSKVFTDFEETVYRDHNALSAKLQTINDGIALIKSALQPVRYIDAKELPFKVVSIDLIEGNPVVSVFYHDTTIALESGFNLAGWQLLKSNYVNQIAEFIKYSSSDDKSTLNKIAHIKVSLNDIQ